MAAIRHEKEKTDLHIYDLALTLIEQRARKILAQHHNLDEFVMGMGSWMFTKVKGEDYIASGEYIPAYAKAFARMMGEFDDLGLKVTGEPMRFTALGQIVREWGATDDCANGEEVAKKYGHGGSSNG